MADTFDPDAYLAEKPAVSGFNPDAYLGSASKDEEPADHGLSERQKLSPVGKALSPITSYWPTYQRMKNESLNQASEGLHQLTHPGSLTTLEGTGTSDILTGAGKAALGAAGY